MVDDHTILVRKNLGEVNNRQNKWRLTLERKSLNISKCKTGVKQYSIKNNFFEETNSRRVMTISNDVIGELERCSLQVSKIL